MEAELHLVVCVRPPEPGSSVTLGALDLHALLYAVAAARGAGAGAKVTAISVGGRECVSALQECVARGADASVHVFTDDPGADGLITARLLADAVGDLGPDLVLAGHRSMVGMHGNVAREVARQLRWPFVDSVVELSFASLGDGVQATALQRLERGDTWEWGCALPMVCGVERDISVPSYLAVNRLRRARRIEPRRVPARVDEPSALVCEDFGALGFEERTAPRIRPKKSKTVAPATMSAADRMKMLRGGGSKAPAASKGGDDRPKKVSGDPEVCATEIVKLLDSLGLRRPDSRT